VKGHLNPSLTITVLAALLCGSACRTATSTENAAGATGTTARTLVSQLLRRGRFFECRDEECMREAFTRCAPAHREQRTVTIEGDPLVFDYFIGGQGGDCRVEVVRDHSADRWGGCQVDTVSCATLESALADDPVGQGCVQGEVVYRSATCPKAASPAPPHCPAAHGRERHHHRHRERFEAVVFGVLELGDS
jgi:hypothetical protein